MRSRRLKHIVQKKVIIFVVFILSGAIFLTDFSFALNVYAAGRDVARVEAQADDDDGTNADALNADDEQRRELEVEKAETKKMLDEDKREFALLDRNVLTDKDEKSQKVAPALPQANEVRYSEDSTAQVKNAEEFLAAYVNSAITRIELTSDIDLSHGPRERTGRLKDLQPDVARYKLLRSLQIDGHGYTLQSTRALKDQFSDNDPLFNLGRITRQQTIHLKNLKVWTRGLNYIKNYDGNEVEGWQLILDDVDFQKHKHISAEDKLRKDGFDQVHRVAKLPRGQIFLRHSVKIESSGENFYVGQVTVEPGADVSGEITHHNYSTWWFVRQEAKLEKTVNIGEGAKVFLGGKPRYRNHDATQGIIAQNATYPAIFAHWQAINVHKGATLSVKKPGHTYEYRHATNGNKHKYINVFEGATIEGITTSQSGNQGTFDDVSSTAIGHFYAAPQSVVRFISGGTSPVINLKMAGSTFELDQPAAYDIRNISELRGAKALKVGKNGYFKLAASNISVWDGTKVLAWDETRERHLHGPADNSWQDVQVIARWDGQPIEGTSPNAHLQSNWNTTKYSRISNVNNNPL